MAAVPGNRRRGSAILALRAALAAFVLAWLFDLFSLRAAVPIWLPFLIALALEVQLFVTARRAPPGRAVRPDRLPQAVDRERYGYPQETGELLLVRRGDEELWVPYTGEADEDLEELIAQARDRAAQEAAAPPPPVPVHSERRPARQLLVGLGVLVALAAVVWVAERGSGWSGLDNDEQSRATARFSAEASRLAGRPVSIRCDEAGDYVGAVQHADGVAAVGGRLAYLAPERCYHLYQLAYEDDVTFSQTARSLAVLAHEVWHLRGVRDEGTTECYALQSGVELGERLGLSEGEARRMMRQQLVENRLRRGASAEYLVPPECHDGGSLDLDPASSDFP